MKVRILSDTHNENFRETEDQLTHLERILPRLDTDAESILILAGDVWKYNRPDTYETFLSYIKDSFKHIIAVSGNHEWYGSTYPTGDVEFLKYVHSMENFHQLDAHGVVLIDDIHFIGATLWTDFGKNNPISLQKARHSMMDYYQIRTGNNHITPEEIYEIHNEELDYLNNYLYSLQMHNHRTVVVTHHCPSYQSIHPKYKDAGEANYWFASDLDEMILRYQPELWVHGHTHSSFDYHIEKTHVIANPCGYKFRNSDRYENADFDTQKVIEL